MLIIIILLSEHYSFPCSHALSLRVLLFYLCENCLKINQISRKQKVRIKDCGEGEPENEANIKFYLKTIFVSGENHASS